MCEPISSRSPRGHIETGCERKRRIHQTEEESSSNEQRSIADLAVRELAALSHGLRNTPPLALPCLWTLLWPLLSRREGWGELALQLLHSLLKIHNAIPVSVAGHTRLQLLGVSVQLRLLRLQLPLQQGDLQLQLKGQADSTELNPTDPSKSEISVPVA
ncbi:hypothetical protein EYF80_006287 [Liparis tanakae]|uniref:Uncharacterized protein n=1 Tax=Liparis tanakae TaxID=230148 RepID=A0A4Z2IZJ7_9TELE|nr:hypothetical protein EYF80_006287 [Liparis tanakae]